jgi:hypothetical protein
MAAEAPPAVIEEGREPMTVQLGRVLKRSASLTPEQRAHLLAKAGVIKPGDVEKVVAKLRAAVAKEDLSRKRRKQRGPTASLKVSSKRTV